MKILRRIFVIITLLLTVFVICYIVRTCKVMNGNSVTYEQLQKSAYKSKNGNILIVSEETVWYITEDNTYFCEFKSYENNALTIMVDKQSFIFKVIDLNVIYDVQEKEFMYRGGTG